MNAPPLPTAILRQRPVGICRSGHPETTLEDVNRQPFLLVMMNPHRKVPRAAQTSKMTALYIALLFLDNQLVSYGVHD